MESHADFAQRHISEAQIDQFDRDGAIILRGVIPDGWIDRMRAAIDAVLMEPTQYASEMEQGGQGRFYGDFFLWRTHPEFRAFIFDSPLAELAQRIMRASQARFFFEQLLVKEPSTAAVTPWHQDLPYWPVDGWQIASIWVPFDRATPETGVVTYVKGSHRWGKLFKPRSFGSGNLDRYKDPDALEEAPDIDAAPQDYEFVTGTLEPGDVFVHHARTLHGAPANTSSDVRRRALATRWLGEDARFEDRPNNFLRGPKFGPLRSELGTQPGDELDCGLFPLVAPRA